MLMVVRCRMLSLAERLSSLHYLQGNAVSLVSLNAHPYELCGLGVPIRVLGCCKSVVSLSLVVNICDA